MKERYYLNHGLVNIVGNFKKNIAGRVIEFTELKTVDKRKRPSKIVIQTSQLNTRTKELK